MRLAPADQVEGRVEHLEQRRRPRASIVLSISKECFYCATVVIVESSDNPSVVEIFVIR